MRVDRPRDAADALTQCHRTLSQKSADGPRGRPGWLARKGGKDRGVVAKVTSHKGFFVLTKRDAGTARGTPPGG